MAGPLNFKGLFEGNVLTEMPVCMRVCVRVLRSRLLLLLPWSRHWCEYPEGDVTASQAACTQPVSIETCQTAKQSLIQLCLPVEGVVLRGRRGYTISTAASATNYLLSSNLLYVHLYYSRWKMRRKRPQEGLMTTWPVRGDDLGNHSLPSFSFLPVSNSNGPLYMNVSIVTH